MNLTEALNNIEAARTLVKQEIAENKKPRIS